MKCSMIFTFIILILLNSLISTGKILHKGRQISQEACVDLSTKYFGYDHCLNLPDYNSDKRVSMYDKDIHFHNFLDNSHTLVTTDPRSNFPFLHFALTDDCFIQSKGLSFQFNSISLNNFFYRPTELKIIPKAKANHCIMDLPSDFEMMFTLVNSITGDSIRLSMFFKVNNRTAESFHMKLIDELLNVEKGLQDNADLSEVNTFVNEKANLMIYEMIVPSPNCRNKPITWIISYDVLPLTMAQNEKIRDAITRKLAAGGYKMNDNVTLKISEFLDDNKIQYWKISKKLTPIFNLLTEKKLGLMYDMDELSTIQSNYIFHTGGKYEQTVYMTKDQNTSSIPCPNIVSQKISEKQQSNSNNTEVAGNNNKTSVNVSVNGNDTLTVAVAVVPLMSNATQKNNTPAVIEPKNEGVANVSIPTNVTNITTIIESQNKNKNNLTNVTTVVEPHNETNVTNVITTVEKKSHNATNVTQATDQKNNVTNATTTIESHNVTNITTAIESNNATNVTTPIEPQIENNNNTQNTTIAVIESNMEKNITNDITVIEPQKETNFTNSIEGQMKNDTELRNISTTESQCDNGTICNNTNQLSNTTRNQTEMNSQYNINNTSSSEKDFSKKIFELHKIQVLHLLAYLNQTKSLEYNLNTSRELDYLLLKDPESVSNELLINGSNSSLNISMENNNNATGDSILNITTPSINYDHEQLSQKQNISSSVKIKIQEKEDIPDEKNSKFLLFDKTALNSFNKSHKIKFNLMKLNGTGEGEPHVFKNQKVTYSSDGFDIDELLIIGEQ